MVGTGDKDELEVTPGTSSKKPDKKLETKKQKRVKKLFPKKKSDRDIDIHAVVEEYERELVEENDFEASLQGEKDLNTCLCLLYTSRCV